MSLGVLLDLLQGVLSPVAHTTHELHHIVVSQSVIVGKIPSVAFMKIFVVIPHKIPKKVANEILILKAIWHNIKTLLLLPILIQAEELTKLAIYLHQICRILTIG